MKTCATCGSKLGPLNRSGFCRKHFSAAKCTSGDHGQKISAALKRKVQEDEEFAAKLRRQARLLAYDPKLKEMRRRNCIERRFWEQGSRHITPESRIKAGRTYRAKRLAWCPEDLRDEYIALMYRSGARKARAVIEAKVEERQLRSLRGYINDAAEFIRVKDRCPVANLGSGEWRYGTVRKSADDILKMATRKGWSAAA